jgi:flagellar biosynthesis/type III secretory pathway M-ring protein FliF/YscJ
VVSNTGASIQSGGGGGSSFEESDEQTSYDTMIGQEVQTIEDPKGHPLKINAVVNIPRSYFVRVYQESGFAAAGGGDDDGGGEDDEADGGAGPDDAALAPVRDAEIARITAEVQSVVDMTAKADGMAGEVLVSMIPLVPEGLATGVAGAGGGSFLTASSGPMSLPYIAKTVSIGLLAVLALGMVLYTTLRANRREALPTAEELVGVPPTFDDDSSILGEAGEAQSALAGIELDDAELAVRKMRDQISEMVQERPARAASLVGHWVGDVG